MSLGSNIDRVAIGRVCSRRGIRTLSLFGSVLAGTDGPDSDVDLLVEFEPGKKPGFLELAGIEEELSAIIGRRVDLRTAEDLSRFFRDDVLRVAEIQYAG
jgi:uncharacterized protein